MTFGDPKKAIVLAVVAVAIVTVAVFRSIPTAGPPPTQQTTAAAVTPPKEDAKVAVEEPVASVDSFSHPNLATKDEQQATARQKVIQGKQGPDKAAVPVVPGRDDIGATFNELTSVSGGIRTATSGSGTEKTTGIGQQQMEEGLITFSVEAVVRGDSALALIKVAEGDARAYRQGDLVNGHIQILAIKEDRVLIAAGGKKREVRVGGQVSL
jgi:hypothetical protein